MTDDESWAPHDLVVDTGGGRTDETAPSDDHPLVTAVVTTHNRFDEATRAIRSVRGQTYEPLEVLIVEDGTDSGVHAWLSSEYDDVRYVQHATNGGLSAARNTAIALARGDYVAFLDDDDEWRPTRVERCVDRLQAISEEDRNHLAVVYCAVESRQDGRTISVVPPENEGNLAEAIRRDGPSTLQSSCLFRRSALIDVGGYDEWLRSSVDHDIWMALAVGGYDAATLDEPLVVSYDEFADSMMTNTETRIEGARQFVEKWRSTYHEWFGAAEGNRRIQRYFARVVGRLAAAKLVTGSLDDASTAVRAIFDKSDAVGYNVRVLAVLTAEAAVKRFAPPRVVRLASQLHNAMVRPDN